MSEREDAVSNDRAPALEKGLAIVALMARRGGPVGKAPHAFQPKPIQDEWRAQLAATVAQVAWTAFEAGVKRVRADQHVLAPGNVTRLVADRSAPVFTPDGVATDAISAELGGLAQ